MLSYAVKEELRDARCVGKQSSERLTGGFEEGGSKSEGGMGRGEAERGDS